MRIAKELTASEITEQVIKSAKPTWELWRSNNISVRGRAFIGRLGAADITGYDTDSGIRIEIEVKKIGDTLSDDQVKFLTHVAASGGIAYVATSDKAGRIVQLKIESQHTRKDIMSLLKMVQI